MVASASTSAAALVWSSTSLVSSLAVRFVMFAFNATICWSWAAHEAPANALVDVDSVKASDPPPPPALSTMQSSWLFFHLHPAAFLHLPFFVWSEQSLGVGAGAGAGSASTQPLFLPSHVQSPAFLHLPFFVCFSQKLF